VEKDVTIVLTPDRQLAIEEDVQWRDESIHGSSGVREAGGENPSGGPVPCRRCGSLNRPELKFCPHCGDLLWEPCAKCGTLCPTGEMTFCGTCGTNLGAAVQELIDDTIQRLSEAQSLHRSGEIDEAISVVSEVARRQHPRLAEYAKRARETAEQLAADRDHARAAVDGAIDKARRFLSDCDWLRSRSTCCLVLTTGYERNSESSATLCADR